MKLPRFIFGTSALGNLYEEKTYAEKLEIVRSVINAVRNETQSTNDKHNTTIDGYVEEKQNEQPLIMLDTAGKYGAGLALETLGSILQDLQVSPESVLISNKLGWERVPLSSSGKPTFESDIWINLDHDAIQSISHDGILRCYHQGNELLGKHGYQAQIVSVHDPDEYCNIPSPSTTCTLTSYDLKQHEMGIDSRQCDLLNAYKALSELKHSNKVHSVGVGTKDYRMIEWLTSEGNRHLVHLDWAMLACSFTIHTHSPDVVALIKQLSSRNISVINSAIFNSGFLLGTDYYNYVKVSRATHLDLYLWRDQFFEVCHEYSLTPLTACLHFNFIHSDVCITSIAINPGNPTQVQEYYDAIKIQVPEAFWDRLRTLKLISI